MKRLLCFVLPLSLCLPGCQPNLPPAPVQSAPIEQSDATLASTQWDYLGLQLAGELTPAIEGSQVTLKFTENEASGNAGCNLFSGGYSHNESTLSFDMLAITERACLDQNLQQQEQDFFQALNTVSHWRIENEQLFLKYAEAAELVFQATEQ